MIQESEYLRMSDKKWQEDFSQIRELIHTTKEQLHRVKQRRASLWQMERCVYTARKHLQKAEKQLNKLHRTAEIGDAAEERLQLIELGEKDRQRAREIGDAAKETLANGCPTDGKGAEDRECPIDEGETGAEIFTGMCFCEAVEGSKFSADS